MKKLILLFFISSIVFAQIKTSQLPIKTAVDSNKYFIVLDTTDATASQRTQRIKWNKFRLDIPNYAYTWSRKQTFADDSLRINGLWYDFPASRDSHSVLFDSLGTGILVWRNIDSLINTSFVVSAGGWTLSGTTPAKIYSDAGIKTHVRSAAGDTTGTALFNNYGTSYFTDNATFADTVTFNIGLLPDANDGAYLGSTAKSFSDLFLASGGVINWDNGDITLTHGLNTLTLGGGDLALGSNNLTLTGSIASTGSRVTKGWFTDLEVTNAPTFNGTKLPSGTGTANEIAYWSATNTLGTLATATYPSLTELSYVKGVTSAIQSQFTGKLGTSLTSAYLFVGNGSNIATGVAMSGDATISNAGAVTVADDSHNHTSTTVSSAVTSSTTTNLLGGANFSMPYQSNTNVTSFHALAVNKVLARYDATFFVGAPDAIGGISFTNANTGSTLVLRDASGNFSAGTITAALTGNASTATSATSATTSTHIAGGGAFSVPYQTASGTTAFFTPSVNTVLSRYNSTFFAGAPDGMYGLAFTNANTASTLVLRDASGNFSAGTITAALTGNASTVTNGVYTNANNSLSGNNTLTGALILDSEKEVTPGGDENCSVSGENTVIFYMTDAYTVTITDPTDGQRLFISNDKDSPANLILTPVRNGSNTSLTLTPGSSVTMRYRSSETTWYSTTP